MTEPITKRADRLVVGDRIPDEYLPMRFNKGPGEVVYVANELGYELGGGDAHTFFAYRYPNGRHDSTTVRSEAELQVIPADPTGLGYSRADDGETTQPLAGRTPPHYGALVNEGGHTATAIGGGLIAIDPPEGFVPASALRPAVAVMHFVIQSGSDMGFTMCGYSPQGVPAEHSLSDTWDGVTCEECTSEAPF